MPQLPPSSLRQLFILFCRFISPSSGTACLAVVLMGRLGAVIATACDTTGPLLEHCPGPSHTHCSLLGLPNSLSHTHTHTRTHTHSSIHMSTHIRTHTHSYTQLLYTTFLPHTHTHTSIHINTHTRTHTHTHTHIHNSSHTNTYTQLPSSQRHMTAHP